MRWISGDCVVEARGGCASSTTTQVSRGPAAFLRLRLVCWRYAKASKTVVPVPAALAPPRDQRHPSSPALLRPRPRSQRRRQSSRSSSFPGSASQSTLGCRAYVSKRSADAPSLPRPASRARWPQQLTLRGFPLSSGSSFGSSCKPSLYIGIFGGSFAGVRAPG